MQSKIYYTKTDEAPALATRSFLPIINSFTSTAGIEVELKDISLAARILANFPDFLSDDQKTEDALSFLGELATKPEANIIKLPNISASISQLKAAIKELQEQGHKIPNYPESSKDDKENEIKSRYAKVLGSAVNPVLREGNSDRRVAEAVKRYSKENPHRLGEWKKESKTHIASMTEGDFFGSEKSHVMDKAQDVSIVFTDSKGEKKILKEKLSLLAGEIVDAAVMSSSKLCAYFDREIEAAKKEDVLLSLHLKATMMKVSDPIIFGYALKSFFRPVFDKYESDLKSVGVNPNIGMADLLSKLSQLPADKEKEIRNAIDECYKNRPSLAMVDSDKGITNLHVPSDIIIDASIPAAIKSSGKMWDREGKLQDTKALIPDRSYAGIYQATIDFCKENGAFDVTSMGSVSNVGLMAKKAQEYGSHDKTFQIHSAGIVQVLADNGDVIFENKVESGDIWRMCQTKEIAIKDWIKLGVKRARLSNTPAIFWLDENRAHDSNLIKIVKEELKNHDTSGLDIQIMNPMDACHYTLDRVKNSQDTISVTGNILRDYLTDLFPILELGTSAKMLSIVPLLAGGGLFETGAGGSAPKHVQQFVEENHLRWDSLGEFLALAVSLEDLAQKTNNKKAEVLAMTLNKANTAFLMNDKSPSRKVGELDTRGSHFYLALYWAKELSTQEEDQDLKKLFTKVADDMDKNQDKIVSELNGVQGKALNLNGYYNADDELVVSFMRPSVTLNNIIDSLR